jgi:hypothetical protein
MGQRIGAGVPRNVQSYPKGAVQRVAATEGRALMNVQRHSHRLIKSPSQNANEVAADRSVAQVEAAPRRRAAWAV